MRRRATILLLLAGAVFGAIVAAGLRLDSTPPFEISAPLLHRPELQLAGIEVEIDTDAGPMVLTAGRARIGYEHLGHLRLGFGSHFLLSGVVLRGPEGASRPWSIRARKAKWTATELSTVGRALGRVEGTGSEMLSDATVDLRSGVVTAGKNEWPQAIAVPQGGD